MATSLYTDLVIIDDYKPYVGSGKNHHHTKIGFNCSMLGDTNPTILQKNIYFIVRQGNHADLKPITTEGTATSAGANNRLTDTTKNFLLAANDVAPYYSYCSILSGTGAGQCKQVTYAGSNYIEVASNWTTNPDNTSVYSIHRVWSRHRTEFENQSPSVYLPHDEYTFYTMAFDSLGTPRVARNYFNVNTHLAGLPPVTNSISPVIIFKKQAAVGGLSTIKVRAKQFDIVKIYWEWQMDDDKLSSLFPRQFEANVNIDGKNYSMWKGTPFKNTPIASATVSASNGEYEFVIPATNIAAAVDDRWIVVSATSPGMGESFACAKVKVFAQIMPYIADAEDMRQNRVIFTPTATTRPAEGGGLEKFYTIDVKNVNLYDGTETAYGGLSEFYYNLNNNGDAYNIPVSTGIWVKVGTTKTVLIVDQNANGATAGTPYSYWSQHIIDAGTPTPEVKTVYSSLSDAVTRGPNNLLPKETATWYSVAWEINSKVYVNNINTDETLLGNGYYFNQPLNMAFQVTNGEIVGKQYVGGDPVY